MRTLVFATNNKHKLHEVREILRDSVLIKSGREVKIIHYFSDNNFIPYIHREESHPFSLFL